MAGTPAFQAPEQLKALAVNKGPVFDGIPPFDIYTFGALLFGEKAVEEQLTPYQVIMKVVLEGATPTTYHYNFKGFVHNVSKLRRIRMTYALLSIDLSN